jgi:hypothetical protein
MKNNIKFENITKQFDNLVKEEKLNINSIEELMLNDIENYKELQKEHIEKLIQSHVDEKELISKKNKNGKKKDFN